MRRLGNIEKRSPGGQRGVIFIWFALLLPVLLGFFGLAYDLARLNQVRVALQNAADAAALTGAMSVTGTKAPYSYTNATNYAQLSARYNYANGLQVRGVTVETGGVDLSKSPPTFTPGQPGTGWFPAVRVTILLSNPQNAGRVHFVFGSFVGMPNSDVRVQAVAARVTLGSGLGHALLVE
jgi:Flp pilus assembly protein TadG